MEGCTLGQVLHGSATTTEAIRRAIQRSQESLRTVAKRHGINPKTVAKWRKRSFVADLPSQRYRTPPDQTQPPLDEWSGRAHEPYPQGSDGQSLSLRRSRAAPSALGRLRHRLQLRSPSQDSERALAL